MSKEIKTNNNGAFRKKKVYFTQVSNTALRDENLSLQAKGLYAIIQSYITIEDFILYKNFLIKVTKLSENTFDKYWKELKDKGYLVQYKFFEAGSKGAKYEYELLDTPLVKEETDPVETTKNKPVFTPQNLRSKNLRPKKLGVYNNTDLNNTNLNNNISSSSCLETNTKNEDDDSINQIYYFAKDNNFKIQRPTIKNLLVAYKAADIVKAIIICLDREDIKSPTSYLKTVLKDITSTKTVVNNISVNNNKLDNKLDNNLTSNYTSNNSKRFGSICGTSEYSKVNAKLLKEIEGLAY